MAQRILILGDSHTREMNIAFKKFLPSCLTFIITVPSGLNAIISKYRSILHHVTIFNPSVVIIHAGHNDIVFHHHHNPHPRNPRTVTDEILQLVDELCSNHPAIRPFISSIFPRTYTARSYLPEQEITPYNKKIKRHGQHLLSITEDTITTTLLNMCLWHRISSACEDPEPFDEDGLHLTKKGKLTVVHEWLSTIYPTTTLST
jgi:lysophospholipase L1-like esterase